MIGTTISADGVQICFETQGKGLPALVLVHGWSCDRTYWKQHVDAFAGSHQVVTIDLAGHGESGQGRRRWTMPAFGADVAAVVEQLGQEQVVLVGHSMGGPVVAEAARILQERVIGVVGADTFRDLAVTWTPAQIAELLAPFRADFPATARRFVAEMFLLNSPAGLMTWIVEDMASAPPTVAMGAMEGNRRHRTELRKTLRELKAPVVAINSDYRPNDLEAAQQCGVEIRLMSGTGHFVMMEDPQTFNRLLEGAVREFVGARATAKVGEKHVGRV